jgi:hypothetical protein
MLPTKAVYNGTPLLGTFSAVGGGSAIVHQHIRDLLKNSNQLEDGEELPESVLEDIKVRGCVAVAPSAGVTVPTLEYRLPSGQVVMLDHQLRTAPIELLFDANGKGNGEYHYEEFDAAIPNAILDTLKQCPVYSHIFLQ